MKRVVNKTVALQNDFNCQYFKIIFKVRKDLQNVHKLCYEKDGWQIVKNGKIVRFNDLTVGNSHFFRPPPILWQ